MQEIFESCCCCILIYKIKNYFFIHNIFETFIKENFEKFNEMEEVIYN